MFTVSDGGRVGCWHVESAEPRYFQSQFIDAWLMQNKNEVVTRMSENGWRYIYGLSVDDEEKPTVVCPRLPEVVFD